MNTVSKMHGMFLGSTVLENLSQKALHVHEGTVFAIIKILNKVEGKTTVVEMILGDFQRIETNTKLISS